MNDFTHIGSDGRARMVDVGDKAATARHAIAVGRVRISAELYEAIQSHSLKKGSLLDVARLAGVMAAKRTDELIPLCHTLPLDVVEVEAELTEVEGVHCVRLMATARVHGKTGIEMEALTAVSVAALTVIDMGKAIDKAMVIEEIRLIEKGGGKSGLIRPHDVPSA